MPELLLDDIFEAKFVFHARHKAVPCEIRPVWRMYALALIIEKCWGHGLEFQHPVNKFDKSIEFASQVIRLRPFTLAREHRHQFPGPVPAL